LPPSAIAAREVPAIALLAGCFVQHLQLRTLLVHRYWLVASLATLVLVGIGMSIGIPMTTSQLLPGEAWLGVLGIVPLAAGAVAGLAWIRNKLEWTPPLVASAGGLMVVGILALGAYRADLQRYDQEMIVGFSRASTEDVPLVSYGVLEPSWVYYSHRNIPELIGQPAAAARLLEGHSDRAIVTKEQLVPAIRRELDGEAIVVASAPHFLRDEKLVILRMGPNRAELEAKAAQGKKSLH